jgi:PAS domain S-box-containing protein
MMANNKFSEITGYSKEELKEKTFQELTHPDDLEADMSQAEALFRGDINSYSMEKRYIRKDGSIVWVKLNGSAVFDEHSKFKMFVGVVEDISEKKNAEEALHVSEQVYKIASTAAKIGAFFRNLETGENYWSPELLKIYGLNPEDPFPLKDGIPESVHPDDRESVLRLAKLHFDHFITPNLTASTGSFFLMA